jgi:hypothetical protein
MENGNGFKLQVMGRELNFAPLSAAPSVKMRKAFRAGSFNSFESRYKPHDSTSQGFIVFEQWEIPSGLDYRYVWTIVDGDSGKMYLSPGYHLVNRIGYVLCEIPFNETEESNTDYVY